jgi:hypothetical protein
MFTLIMLSLSLAAIAINIALSRKPRTPRNIIEIILLYLLVINVGLGGLIAFYGHTFRSDEIARSIGWQPGSPFQYEIAIANLSYGILGVLCLWLRKDFWLAAGIGAAVFGLGAAAGHIRDIILYHNYAPNNAGLILWFGDIFMPLFTLSLLLVYRSFKE